MTNAGTEGKVTLSIDGARITARQGQSVFDAANENGIAVPSLCHHKDLSPVGSCRLCLVEVDGLRSEAPACTLKVAQGMVVRTETPRLAKTRKFVLELLLVNYFDRQLEAGAAPDTEFMHWVEFYGARLPDKAAGRPRCEIDSDPHPVIRVDLNKCILCTRCVRACADVQGRFVWGVAGRGENSRLTAGSKANMIEARCESCGACVAFCPTGALDNRMSFDSGSAEHLVTTTCPYCGVGCNFDLNVRGGKLLRVTSNPYAPVNGMHLCVKGRYGYDFVHHAERLLRPRVRRYLLEGGEHGAERGPWVETDWDTALDIVARKLAAVKRESSGSAIGVLASAKCTNEENYLMQKFARQVLGTHNVDHCARLCHASTVAGLAMCFGSGAMSNTLRDVAEQAAAILVIGSNTTEQHPVFGSMLRQAARTRGAKLVIADPRRIDLAEFATLHIRQRPGTDVALVNGLMHIIIEQGWHDRAFINARTEGFEELRATVAGCTPQRVAEITGVSPEQLHRCAELLALNRPMAVVWAMGITQHTTGVLNVLSLGNLQMLLGNMGVPGGGVNPLRGQNNVQGACDMGALANFFPGYQTVIDPGARAKFAAAWALESEGGAPTPGWGDKPGLTVTEMIDAAGSGAIRALYLLGENPTTSDPDSNHVKECLARAEFVVLQEIFPSDTAAFADVLLPATSWAEKDGTFTNTERRIQLVREAIEPLGESRPDWVIVTDLARRMLALEHLAPRGPQAAWDYTTPWDILDEIAALVPQYAGVDHERLEQGEQLHWPVKDRAHPGTPILHVGQFSRGKGKFHACEHLPPQELPDREYPLLLTTGRVLYHWHGGEMTRRSEGLLAIYPRTLVEINPEDAKKLGLIDGATVRVLSRRGEMVALAVLTERVAPGVVFGNFHFPGTQNVNNLTIAALDPIAKIPEYKVCAVRVEKSEAADAESVAAAAHAV
ncbi:MAG: formate dehydrogenase subunit alpha [Betaproteobacteria bacterium]|nr:formate dehydrogenase subunit alpha [Betaproteobacteria bacterium]